MNNEEWYAQRDAFIRYIETEINPRRRENGLSEIRECEARECFRIIHDFQNGAIKF